jgi:Tfp pilus assembly protein PilV
MKTAQISHREAADLGSRPAPCPKSPASAFSLVEVVIAIGIFAFVIVGIVGLFPAALRIRAESSLDTRSAMIAQQIMAAVDTSPSLTNVVIPTGTYVGNPATKTNNLLSASFPTVLGYQALSTLPYWIYQTSPNASWSNVAAGDTEVANSTRQNSIDTMVRVTASTNNLSNNLAQITVEVRSPAALAASNSRIVTFTTIRPIQ